MRKVVSLDVNTPNNVSLVFSLPKCNPRKNAALVWNRENAGAPSSGSSLAFGRPMMLTSAGRFAFAYGPGYVTPTCVPVKVTMGRETATLENALFMLQK